MINCNLYRQDFPLLALIIGVTRAIVVVMEGLAISRVQDDH